MTTIPNSLGYALLCVIVPAAWGLLVYWITGFIERAVARKARRQGKPVEEDAVSVEYYI